RRGHTRLFTTIDASIPHPFIQRADMDTEVACDLRERDISITVLGHTDHIIAELLGKRFRHDDILPDQPSQASHTSCHLSLQQTPGRPGPPPPPTCTIYADDTTNSKPTDNNPPA